jgi:hypothetical protein
MLNVVVVFVCRFQAELLHLPSHTLFQMVFSGPWFTLLSVKCSHLLHVLSRSFEDYMSKIRRLDGQTGSIVRRLDTQTGSIIRRVRKSYGSEEGVERL